MSKTALTFLILAVMALALGHLAAPTMDAMSTVATIAACVFGSLFVAALFVGRRIKFDPVLR
jgi:hypothetical protein